MTATAERFSPRRAIETSAGSLVREFSHPALEFERDRAGNDWYSFPATAMLFCASRGGISHAPDEDVLELGIAALDQLTRKVLDR